MKRRTWEAFFGVSSDYSTSTESRSDSNSSLRAESGGASGVTRSAHDVMSSVPRDQTVDIERPKTNTDKYDVDSRHDVSGKDSKPSREVIESALSLRSSDARDGAARFSGASMATPRSSVGGVVRTSAGGGVQT